MRLITLLIFLAFTIAHADTIDLLVTGTSNGIDDCVNFPGCSPFDISIPQFDPSLGTLTSVAWSFTDYQQFYGGYNDLSDPIPGDQFTWSTTEGDESNLLGLTASNSQVNSGEACGCRQISMGGWWSEDSLDATGVVPDDSPFIGIGTLNIPITPFVSASFPTTESGAWVVAGILFIEDSATLTLTETYTAAAADPTFGADVIASTPEPRYGAFLLAISGLIVRLISRFRSAPAPSKCWGCAAPGKDGQCPICGREQREAEAREKGEYARACDKAIGHSV